MSDHRPASGDAHVDATADDAARAAGYAAEVRARGIVRGRELDAAARVTLEPAGLRLAWSSAMPWVLAFDGIDGVDVGATSARLYLRDHDVLELSGDEALRPLLLQLCAQLGRLPELTRGLRAFGAVRSPAALHAAHDRWFAPFVAARRAVHDVTDPARQVALLQGRALAADVARAIEEIAATRAATDAAERRALEAALEDEAAPLLDALTHMHVAGEAVRGAASDTVFADWRRWVQTVQVAYAAADEAWVAVAEVLSDQ
ncbi:MAG: hypothetical protein LCH84_05330 [Gemmatimonadetes bacterium]|nr:hypothetical protein [Gemmatimonadota bacterium]